MAPAAGFVDAAAASACDGGACAGDDGDAIAIGKGGGEAGLAVAADGDDGGGPDVLDEGLEAVAVGGIGAPGKEGAYVGGMGREDAEEVEEGAVGDEAEIGGGEGADAEFEAAVVEECPLGLRAAALDAQDELGRGGVGRHGGWELRIADCGLRN